VLFVALNTSRWGARFRRTADGHSASRPLSPREREIVRLVALGATGQHHHRRPAARTRSPARSPPPSRRAP
jgi:hypothetical protein